MVLVVDSNEYRREKIARRCRTSDLPAMAIDYEYYGCYTFPLVTVIIDPKKDFLANFRSNENTLFILVVKREENKIIRNDVYTVCCMDGYISPDKIKEIIFEKFSYNLKDDGFNRVRTLPVCQSQDSADGP